MHSTTPLTNGTTKHATPEPETHHDDPIVNAREMTSTALDLMDRMLGTVLGIIDDQDGFLPTEADVARVRRIAAKLRSNLTAVAGELGRTMTDAGDVLEAYDWPATATTCDVARVSEVILTEAREHASSYLPASWWSRRIGEELTKGLVS